MLPGVDYNETFAPAARVTSIRILLAIACKEDLEVKQYDFKTAFLSAKMDHEVYVTLPPGFSTDPALDHSRRNSSTVHRLLRGVPGIPQGSHLFNKKLHNVLQSMSFTRLNADYCIYKHTSADVWISLALWVDDLLVAYRPEDQSVVDQSHY